MTTKNPQQLFRVTHSMFFKNLRFYRLPENFSLDQLSLGSQLSEHRFRHCGSQESTTYGWVAPLNESSEELVYSHERHLLVSARRETKILPSSVINLYLNEKIADIEAKEDRKVRRKEKLSMKDDVIFDLLPRAFSRYQNTYAYFDLSKGLLIIDASSAQNAEDLCNLLRESLGSLAIKLAITETAPAAVMTDWLKNKELPVGLSLGNDAELQEPKPEGAVIRCKQQDLASDEITNHLDAGKQALKLAVEYNHRLTCVVHDDLSIKRLKFTDIVLDDARDMADNSGDESEEAQFAADFVLMSSELSDFIPMLLEAMGGDQPQP